MQMVIESVKVDVISNYKNVVDYLLANNDKYEIQNDDWINEFADNFCFAVRKKIFNSKPPSKKLSTNA